MTFKSSLKPGHLTVRKFGLLAGFIFMMVVLAIFLFNVFDNRSENNAANQARGVFSNNEIIDYSSPSNNFTIKFPGFPVVTKTSYTDGQLEIQQTIYERKIDADDSVYQVQVHNYADTQKQLELKVNEHVKSLADGALVFLQPTTFEGHEAFETVYTYKVGNETKTVRARFISRESRIYIVSLEGGDQVKYDEFVKSLNFV